MQYFESNTLSDFLDRRLIPMASLSFRNTSELDIESTSTAKAVVPKVWVATH